MTVSSLLYTKLNRPRVAADHIDRPRLLAMLNRGLAGQITLVSAGAGFGKTTLVSSWIENLVTDGRLAMPSAWLSLDASDSDLVVFLRYFVAAIRRVFPEACPETLALLQAPAPIFQATLLVALTNEIETLPDRIVLILDDYHMIRGEAVHDFLSEVLRHWPPHLHVVLISRTSPPLPLANLRATGQLIELRTRDLRFTPEESAAFLQKALPSPLSQSAIDILDERLEGWIAGLRLVSLSLSTGSSKVAEVASLSGTQVEIAEYLVNEVLSSQPPAMLNFLLATSIFGRFCAELCEYVLASADGVFANIGIAGSSAAGDAASMNGPESIVHECIRWLESHNLFVVPLDSDGKWYRYHHLFRDLLQRRLLAEVGREQVTELHRAAAAWLGERGLIDEAIRHSLNAADLDLAARVMVAGLRDALNREDRPMLDQWLSALPEDFVQHNPWLLMIKALAFQFSWQLSAVGRLLPQIEALAEEVDQGAPHSSEWDAHQTMRGLIALLNGQQAFTHGQAASAITFCEEALALLPEAWRYARGGAILYWGVSMRAIGQSASAQRALLAQYESLLNKADGYALRLLFAVCFNALETGDLQQARRIAQVMLDWATPGRLMILVGFAHYFSGVVHYYGNELEAARQHFEAVVDERYAVHAQAARNCMIGLALVHLARGEKDDAWETMELLSRLDMERAGEEGDDARSLRAQMNYLQGDTEAAYCWADAYSAAAPDRLLNWLQDPHLVKARLLLTRSTAADLQAALTILDALYEITQRSFSTRLQIEILALRALAYEKQEKSAAAIADLEQAVQLARPGGFIRTFVDLGPRMQTLLLRLAGRGFAFETVRRILAAFLEPLDKVEPLTGYRARTANAGLIEPLTERELEILVLLRERLSNKEIANHLDLSVMTVKRHACNIYDKLGVDNRRDAVLKAETLRILPPA